MTVVVALVLAEVVNYVGLVVQLSMAEIFYFLDVFS